jgi:hypothetical protein
MHPSITDTNLKKLWPTGLTCGLFQLPSVVVPTACGSVLVLEYDVAKNVFDRVAHSAVKYVCFSACVVSGDDQVMCSNWLLARLKEEKAGIHIHFIFGTPPALFSFHVSHTLV